MILDYTINGGVANSELGDFLSRMRTVEGRSPSAFFEVPHNHISAASQRRLGSSSPPSVHSNEMYNRPMSDNDRIRRHHPSTDFTSTPRTCESIENAGFVSVNMPPYMEQDREEMVENNDIQSLERKARAGAVDENQHASWDAVNFISTVASALSIQSGPLEKLPLTALLSMATVIFNSENTPLSTKKRLMIMGTVLTALALHAVIGVCSYFGII